MITILVVGGASEELAALASRYPSTEILVATGVEDAIEKLARNRRIDAVLLAPGAGTAAIAAAIRDEDPDAPPLFAGAAAGTIPGVESLPGETMEQAIAALVRRGGQVSQW